MTLFVYFDTCEALAHILLHFIIEMLSSHLGLTVSHSLQFEDIAFLRFYFGHEIDNTSHTVNEITVKS